MDERIVVSLSVSHINGRLEGIKKQLERQIGHEPSVAEIREYVQDLCYEAIDETLKPKPTTFYVKLGTDSKPTGVFLIGREYWNENAPVELGEQWATIEAVDVDELQHKMKTFK